MFVCVCVFMRNAMPGGPAGPVARSSGSINNNMRSAVVRCSYRSATQTKNQLAIVIVLSSAQLPHPSRAERITFLVFNPFELLAKFIARLLGA